MENIFLDEHAKYFYDLLFEKWKQGFIILFLSE